ncbi:MAG: hypothetical protein OXE85_13680 [Roseovarius sp.]|nr:hypothetical protein [Roseovarius sp.]
MNESFRRPGGIRKFNPGMLESDEDVKNQFVVRNRELGIVMDVLQGNIDSPSCQHILLVAPRGRGKTMLLARVAAELRTDQALSERLLPVRFMEESQEIFSMADFWLEVLFYLACEHVAQNPQFSRELQAMHAALAAEWHGGDLEERARAAVLETVDRLGKQLVLMVENLQALCEDVDDDFGWKLRRVLQSEPEITLLATATSRFKGLDDASEPFFELFRILRLEPLDTGECRCLWRMVSGDKISEREIRPLQILTGGDPRLLMIIGDFSRHRSLRQLMEEMVTLIDEHTEYFRGHLEVFAKTERRVYLAVIDLWQPSSTGDIAARARMDVRIVSALLGRLVERGVVLAEGSGRKRKYATAERLYSIYYKLRRERDTAVIVRNLIHFMAVYYAESELDDWFRTIAVEAAQWPAICDGLMRAIGDSPKTSRIFHDEMWPELEKISKRSVAILNARARGVLDEITAALGKNEFEKVIEIADRFLSSEKYGLPQVPDLLVASIVSAKAFAYEGLDKPKAELAIYDEVIERFGSGEAPELQRHLAMVLIRKGITLEQLGKDRAAVATFDEMADRLGSSREKELQVWIAKALLNKGRALERLGENRMAIDVYDQVMERFGDTDMPEVQVQVAIALMNKGARQLQLGEITEAIDALDEIIERFGDMQNLDLQKKVANALKNRGLAKFQLGKRREAIDDWEDLVRRFEDCNMSELQTQVVEALLYKTELQVPVQLLEQSLRACDDLDKRIGVFSDQVRLMPSWRTNWLRVKALIVKQEYADAMIVLDSLYAEFDPDAAPMMRELIERVLDLVANGISESDLVELFSRDKDKSDALLPLVVALRQRAGDTVPAPVEVLEVATDIHRMIEARSAVQ